MHHVPPASSAVRPPAGRLGVVTIPGRRGEAERLRRKQEAGASFAVSQILCEPEAAVRLQAEAKGEAPFTLFWSLAPVARRRDVEFLRWLGVDIPPAVSDHLLAESSPAARLRRSDALNLAIARRLLEAAEASEASGRGRLAVGFCVEHVMLSNLEAAIGLVEQVRELARGFSLAVSH